MQFTHIDSQTLNNSEGIVFRSGGGNRGAFQINTSTRNRAGLPPAVDGYVQTTRTATYRIWAAADYSGSRNQFDELVKRVFYPALGLRTFTATRGGVTYTTQGYVRTLRDMSNATGVIWEVDLELPTGLWEASTPVVVSTFTDPVEVDGNVPALPLISVSGGDSVTRQRVTITDRTGHGVSAYMVTVAPAVDDLEEANYVIYANGLQVPFSLEGGRLYFRVDCPPPPERTYVDIYQGAAINNTTTAGRLDPAGLTLAASLASGTVEADTGAAISNPLAPSLAWHPSITYRHESRRPYVYGLDGSEIVMIESDVARDVVGLADDVDSYVIVTGVEAERIRNLNLTIQAGYQPSQQEASGGPSGEGKAVMRVIIKEFVQLGSWVTPSGTTNWSLIQAEPPSTPYHASWTLGLTTFPILETSSRTFSVTLPSGGAYEITYPTWSNNASIHDFAAVVVRHLNIPVTTGDPGVYYLWFDQPPPEMPLMSMNLQGFSGVATQTTESGGSTSYPLTGRVPVVVFESMWVDPVTLEPLDSNPETSDLLPDPIRGMARAVVKYRTRDSEHWITAWSREVVGSGPSGTLVSLSGLNIATPGAVEIAIGLEPVAARASNADWGRLAITSVPTIDLVSNRTPSTVISSAISAQQLNETIRNLTTGARVQLLNYLCDGGLEIDTANLQIRGAGGVGPVYGDLRVNRGASMLELRPGPNNIEATDTSVSLTYRPRVAV